MDKKAWSKRGKQDHLYCCKGQVICICDGKSAKKETMYCSSERKNVCHKYLILHMLKCKKGSQVTQPCSLAIEMPCPPVIADGEVQRSYPRLRAELRHLEIMVSAALMQTQGVGYKVWEKQLTYQLL